MMRMIQDLRIGTKLAITSALTILVVAAMIYLQMTGGVEVRKADDNAARQQATAQNAAEAKASVRGMQMAIRDVLMATGSDELEKGSEFFAGRMDSALKFTGEMAKLSASVENGERIARLKVLIEDLGRGKQQIETVRKQELAIKSKNADHGAEASAQMAKLAQEIARIRKEVTAPKNSTKNRGA